MSLFSEHWWLDAVAPGRWGEATVRSDGEITARLPWARERLPVPGLHLTRLGSPRLTPFLAPMLELGSGKHVTRLAREHRLLEALLDDLPPFDYLSYTFDPSFTNWLPFYWRGLTGSLRATYVLDDITDLDAVWHGMSDTTRRIIRTAEPVLQINEDQSAGRLADALTSTFARQGRRMPFPLELLERLQRAVGEHDAGAVLSATDELGRLHGALMVVWDERRAYYLTGGAITELRRSGAQSLLMWRAIRLAAERVPVFDFEGSMIEGVARFFRGFGSRPCPYLHVTGTSRRMRIGLAARDLGKALVSR
jgi:GNAT acetyltransferase-like protein